MPRFNVEWKKAVAELVTIVAGVLIALAANDWRDGMRDRAEMKSYEVRLDTALASDVEGYARNAAIAASIDSAALEVLAVYRGRPVAEAQASDFVQQVLRASWMPGAVASRDTYDDLVATGNLRLLAPRTREAIGGYYREVRLYDARSADLRQELSEGYWRVPARVLGPDLLPRIWTQLATAGPYAAPRREGVPVSARELAGVVARLRAIPNLEPLLADVRHVMAQNRLIYADRLTGTARQARKALGTAAPRR